VSAACAATITPEGAVEVDISLYGLFRAAYRVLERLAAEELRGYRLTTLEMYVLEALPERGHTHARQLASLHHFPSSSTARAFGRLAELGYVELDRGAVRDRRVVRATLTTTGRSVRLQLAGWRDGVDAAIAGSLTPAHGGMLYAALLRIARYGTSLESRPYVTIA
jgi:DNA-binding MarR family transcriptional regulator